MLRVITSFGLLPFEAMMKVYEKTNREQGNLEWPWESADRQLALAEEAMYDYLQDCFFKTPGAAYCLWLEQDRPVSALRWEPYRDGVLLTALETAPAETGKGYATKLLTQALEVLRAKDIRKVYVHSHRGNTPSKIVHQRCGFLKASQGARLLDGSYRPDFDTYTWEKRDAAGAIDIQ